MRHYLFLLLLTIVCGIAVAKPKDLSMMSEKSRNKYLVKMTAKATKDFLDPKGNTMTGPFEIKDVNVTNVSPYWISNAIYPISNSAAIGVTVNCSVRLSKLITIPGETNVHDSILLDPLDYKLTSSFAYNNLRLTTDPNKKPII